MSNLIIEVCKVDNVEKHPNADRLEIVHVKGWSTVVQKDQYKIGDKCVYIPPDSILPVTLSDRLGITKYLTEVPPELIGSMEVEPLPRYRVRVSRLRGFPSYGLIMKPDDPEWPIGKDVSVLLDITKWEPKQECVDGDAETPHPAFIKYFTLEHWQNFPDVIQDGEEVVVTEKIHGSNARIGIVRDCNDRGKMIWRFMAGSHDVRRKELQTQRKRRTLYTADGMPTDEDFFFEITKRSRFFEVLDLPGSKDLLLHLCNGQNNVVVFGELFGDGIQDMTYGLKNGRWDFRVFDITLEGKYLNYDVKKAACDKYYVPMVPVLYRGPFNKEIIEKFVSGPTTVCSPEEAGSFKGREGIVITTTKERTASTEKKFFDRAAFKAVSFEYLERKGGTENH